MKYIDLFSGLGAFHTAFPPDFECVFACDIDAGARTIYEANYGLNPAADIREVVAEDVPDHDILCAGFPCFVTGTRVLTAAGYKPIETVTLDDTLMTHTGRFRSILNLQSKVYEGQLYTIRIKYHPETISCTDEHPFYVREKLRVWDNTIRRYTTSFGPAEWKTAKTLTMNHYFGMNINTRECIPEFSHVQVVNQRVSHTKTLRLDDPAQWFMMGYFVGDGWIEESTKSDGRLKYIIKFAINNKDEDDIYARIRKILPITDKKCDTGRCKKFGCSNQEWYTILKQFGKYAHGKRIPEWVQDAPIPLIREFVAGYMRADGYVRSDGIYSITTVSPDLALGTQRLFLKLGNIASVTKCNRPKKCVIAGRLCNQRDTYSIRVTPGCTRYTSFIEGEYAWFAPTSILSKSVEDEPVYNFEVAVDNSYVVENIIVHNCQPFSIAGNGEGFADAEKGNLFTDILRIIDAKGPRMCILENVKNLETHDKGRTYAIIKEQLELRGYTVVSKVMDASKYGSPQCRQRIFIVATQGSTFEFPAEHEHQVPVSAIIDPEETRLWNSEGYELVAKNGIPRPFHPHAVFDVINSKTCKGGRQGERVYSVDSPGITVCASSGGPGAKTGLYRIGDGVRRLTVKETMGMFGFPHTFTWVDTPNEKCLFYLGNSIVVNVVRACVPEIIEWFRTDTASSWEA